MRYESPGVEKRKRRYLVRTRVVTLSYEVLLMKIPVSKRE